MPYTDKHALQIGTVVPGLAVQQASDKDGNIWQPDYTDPLFLKYGRTSGRG